MVTKRAVTGSSKNKQKRLEHGREKVGFTEMSRFRTQVTESRICSRCLLLCSDFVFNRLWVWINPFGIGLGRSLKSALSQQGLELLLLNLENHNLTSSVFLHNVELRIYCIVLPAVSVQCGFSYAGNNLETCLILCAVKLEYLSFQFILAGSHYFPICSKIK